MKKLATGRGGKCLSTSYINVSSKLRWQCKEGHEWESVPASVKHRTWCPVCAGNKSATIYEMHKIAEERGGKCLSDEYINREVKLTWQCKEGHQWAAVPASIKSGTWCPACAGKKKQLTIEEMQELAAKRGGKCLSTRYINALTKLSWQCGKGHQWEARPTAIKTNEHWCPMCHGTRKHPIELMQQLAKERGGKCLSTTYVNAHTKLLWECKQGHQWHARPMNIKNSRSWCPGCSGRWGRLGKER